MSPDVIFLVEVDE